ncbi:MAG TPA: NAD(P)/FAD-dependent oxidoreductase, partial [Thermoanaerobaculia bacterium]
MTDILISGAGLAGLECARLLAGRGVRVVLADRKTSPAQSVHTTGIFVRKTWEDFPLPEEQLGAPIREVTLHSPAGRTLHLVSERDEFRVGRMQWLYLQMLEQCARSGVQWLPATRIAGFDGTTAIAERHGRTERIRARYVIGADGARSLVARAFGLDTNTELLHGIEEIVPPVTAKPSMHCWLDPRLAPGYIAWLVSDEHEAHLGVAGYRDRFVPAQALEALKQRVTVGKPLERRGGVIPVNGILRNIASTQAMLIGDAAGAVSPLTAGGLDAALRLSTFAADVAFRYLDSGDATVVRQYSGEPFRARFVTR